jgi:hypothetical protein
MRKSILSILGLLLLAASVSAQITITEFPVSNDPRGINAGPDGKRGGIASLAATNAPSVTFTKDVAPVLQKNCQGCHRPGEAAPFSLLTYDQARPWAKAMKEAVLLKKMPPWFADPHYGKFSNDRSLAQKEIDTLAAWADGGAPQGDPKDLPPPVKFVEGWRIPAPDVVFEMPRDFNIPAAGTIDYQYVVVSDRFPKGPMGATRRSPAGKPRAGAPHRRVHPRAGFQVAEGCQAGCAVCAEEARGWQGR